MALVSVARYRILTGDTTSPDGDIVLALEAAQALAEDYLRRPLESATRTEVTYVYDDGYVYPQATPVTSSPSGYTIQLNGSAVSGAVTTWTGFVDTGTTTISYTGGYSSTTVPRAIERAIARAAYDGLNSPTDVPAGATSVRLGDAAVTYARPAGQSLPPDVQYALDGYRRRRM